MFCRNPEFFKFGPEEFTQFPHFIFINESISRGGFNVFTYGVKGLVG